jgi:hypothetical protein
MSEKNVSKFKSLKHHNFTFYSHSFEKIITKQNNIKVHTLNM